MLAAGKIAGIGDDALKAWQRTLASMRRAGREARFTGLIPKGHARIIILSLVPTCGFVVWVFIRRNPTEMFEGHFDAGLENDGIVDVPAIGAGVAAHDAPLVEVRHAEVRRAGLLQSPGGEKVVFGAGATDGWLGFAIDVDFLVALAEPGWAARAHRQHRADIMAFAACVEQQVILAFLDRIFLAVLGIKIRRVLRQLILSYPVDVVVKEAYGFFTLVNDFDASRFPEWHSPKTIVGIRILDDHRQADDFATLPETIDKEIADRRFDCWPRFSIPIDTQQHFLMVG